MEPLREQLAAPLTATFLEATTRDYLEALGIFIVLSVVFLALHKVVLWRLAVFAERTKTDIDDVLIRMVKSFRPPFYVFLALYVALQVLGIQGIADTALTIVLIAWVVYRGIAAGSIFIDYVLVDRIGKEKDATTRAALRLIGRISKGVLWGLGILLVLSNLGVNITSLIAGIGIGGIAIAFALQSILSDLFSSFSIYFDKPFEVGDFIVVGDTMGTIERIGIKTTRLRALQGEEIVMSNHELTSTRIHNYKKMGERRIVFTFGVLYETPIEKLEQIPSMVYDIVNATEDTRVDRVHFKEFGDSALVFEAVYYVLSADYNAYMDTQQHINLELARCFEKQGIGFAYPTRTVYLKQ